jgi:hypothetical protein
MQPFHITILAGLFAIMPHTTQQVAAQDNDPVKKVYTGKQLVSARDGFKDYTFDDRELGELFSRENKKVTAIVLQIKHSGNDISEIKVSVNYQKETGLKPVKTLTQKNVDFRPMVDNLRLK